MSREPNEPCPVTYALEVFGDRWTLLVLRDLMLEGRSRYGEVLAAHPGLATNVLSDRLKRLERRGLISKARDSSDARQYVYAPTERALGLVPMLVEMMVWAARDGGARTEIVERFDADRAGLIEEMRNRVRARIGDSL